MYLEKGNSKRTARALEHQCGERFLPPHVPKEHFLIGA